MDEVDRRAFLALVASAELASGCTYMNQTDSDSTTRQGESTRTTESRESASGDTVVTTLEELETTFEDLSPGDTVYISAENAPYRTTRWLDIDVDGVTVIGPGVETLIKPVKRSNVGGIRIGHNRRCREVDVRGVGYHGNPDGQRRSAERLHGIAVRNAANVTLERNQIRHTHPRRHGDGGSGISVGRRCSDVRIFNNRIHRFGDRGVQLGGERVTVFGNAVTNGLDRPVACDIWDADEENSTAQSVSVFGNLLGNSAEGSLVGAARNEPVTSNQGYLSVFGNVGFGSHKSFCHLRGPKPIRNVSVQNNVSVQQTEGLTTEETKRFAGIAVDPAGGRNIGIKNNQLYGYSGHGIHVNSSVTGLSVQHNDVSDPGLMGIRLAGECEGVVSGNLVTRPTKTGIRVRRAAGVAVRGNYVQRPGGTGIVTEASASRPGNDVVGNYVLADGPESGGAPPGIHVRDTGVSVRNNVVRRPGGSAILEGEQAENNLYVDNRADGENPWRITSPTSRVRGHTPPVGVHRGVTTGPESSVVTVEFDRPHARPPRVSFGRTGGGVEGRSFQADESGNYVGVELTTRREGATLDVFVDDV